MPLSDIERLDVQSRAIALILNDFGQDFQDIYSYAVTVLELAPEQANNEIRNGLNHLVRAITAENIELANTNLGQAEGHFERARRDCLKLAVIHLHEQAKSDMLSIERIEGALPMTLRMRLKTIEHSGYEARRAEARGDSGTTDLYATVMASLGQFRDDLAAQHTFPSRTRGWISRQFWLLRSRLFSLAVGVLIGVASHWIYDHAARIASWASSMASSLMRW